MLVNKEKKCVNLLLGFTGSVATIKYLDIIDIFCSCLDPVFRIKIVLTQKAKNFITKKFIDQGLTLLFQRIWIEYKKGKFISSSLF